MPSVTEPPSTNSEDTPRSWRLPPKLARWNRKLHFYAGLMLLFFMWLFAFTGLILNHPTWTFPESWKNRRETNYVREVTAPGPGLKGDLAVGREVMRQLGLQGEILLTTPRKDTNLFDFQVRRPGYYYFLKADFGRNSVAVREATVNTWGVMKVLHTFSGVSLPDGRKNRDWIVTTVWALSMDVVAAGLIFMVLSSLHMWWELRQKRWTGLVALGLGSLVCGLFCFGLRWIF